MGGDISGSSSSSDDGTGVVYISSSVGPSVSSVRPKTSIVLFEYLESVTILFEVVGQFGLGSIGRRMTSCLKDRKWAV